jgi:hypothetical protein
MGCISIISQARVSSNRAWGLSIRDYKEIAVKETVYKRANIRIDGYRCSMKGFMKFMEAHNHTHTHACTRTRTRTRTRAFIHAHSRTYVCTQVHMGTHTHGSTYMCMHRHVHAHVSTCMHAHINDGTNTCTSTDPATLAPACHIQSY